MTMVHANEGNGEKIFPGKAGHDDLGSVSETKGLTEIVIEKNPEVRVAGDEEDDCSGALSSSSSLSSPRTDESEQFQNDSSSEGREGSDSDLSVTTPKINSYVMCAPHFQLPNPEVPPGISATRSPELRNWKVDSESSPNQHQINRSLSLPETVEIPAIGKYIRERSNSLSAAITKRLSSLRDDAKPQVTEFNLSGLKVIVKHKSQEHRDSQPKGRITFFSRSECRDCASVRSFFREKGLRFVEINVDVYPEREKELVQRSESSQVPQVFFNENLFGGLVVLNSLRNSGEFDQRLAELLGRKCPDDAPSPPVYGFDEPEGESTDDMMPIMRVLRKKLPIQDRLTKMTVVRNCFAGSEMVELLIDHLDCGRKKAVEIGKQLARKHFIHHVFGKNDFEDGNHFYRFLEHEPFISKCFNFQATNDSEPKSAAKIGIKLAKLMSAILESYASDDGCHVDYASISKSEEFRRYVNLIQELHRVNLLTLSSDEKMAFFLNLYNAMVIHTVIRRGRPEGIIIIDREAFFSEFQYVVGGHSYSLSAIKNGILRSNRRPPYSLAKPFGSGDNRLEVALQKVNPLIHFGACNGTKSSPRVRFFSPQLVEAQLRRAAREFLKSGGLEVDLGSRTVYLTRIIKWSSVDFGNEKELLKWIVDYLDPNRAGLLTHLLGDGGSIHVVYQSYDWSVNS